MTRVIEALGPALADAGVVSVGARERPWKGSGIHVRRGDRVTLLREGRMQLLAPADLWIGPQVTVWARISPRGPLERGTRHTHTFTAAHDGEVELGNGLPGEFIDTDGTYAPAPWWARTQSGGTVVAVLHWKPEIDPGAALATAGGALGDRHCLDEASRLAQGPAPLPDGWSDHPAIGPSEIFTSRGHTIRCSTNRDVGIIRHPATVPMTRDTELSWSWNAQELPSLLAEDTLLTHDYLSIAVAFDNGLDLTYQWSAALSVGTVYRCPLPHWSKRETHAVLRSGTAELGTWLSERRNLAADYATAIGGPAPAAVTEVWLIANSACQRRTGRCSYRDIRLGAPGHVLQII